ncbi:MAG: hypothetical protein H6621_09105 [Halobacteriovoraceae bacterium]|nr:hypothetical protein [Halobacteriovoraceae bacterium]MCB9095212.1 hypothetical protein [Halobacteriovoraceae bacterium]
MDKKVQIVIAAAALGVAVLLIFLFTRNNGSEELEPISVQTTTTTLPPQKEREPETTQSETDQSQVNESNEVRKKFDNLLLDIKSSISQCRDGIEKLFPEKNLDEETLPYNSPEEIKQALNQYYSLVNDKLNKTEGLINFFKNEPINKLDPKSAYEQLAQIEDCGEFEEESIVDALIGSQNIHQWDSDTRKDLSSFLIKKFLGQLDQPVNLHHIISKIESLETLIEQGFISEQYKDEISRLNTLLDDAEMDFRNIVPSNLANRKYLTPAEILDIKEREKEITNRVKNQFVESLSIIQGSLTQ